MNLDILISASNWLYENSPAKHISKEKNAILVYGDGELADILFDILFTTVSMPNSMIELVRVCKDADEMREAFLNRNPEGLVYFARTPVSDDALRSPLAIHFLDEKLDWQSFNYAFAILPEEIGYGQEIGFVASLKDVPILRGKGAAWSAQDEADVQVLRIARKVHTAYTLGWNDRYREEDIDRDLYGSLTNSDSDSYMLRSSIRLAVSIPWKLTIAGARDAYELYRMLNDKRGDLKGYSVRDYLAWQEHRSWQAFMILNGWRAPTEQEMADYLFTDGNDHRNKTHINNAGVANPLHPCLSDFAKDDWFQEDKRVLKSIKPSQWSVEYENSLDSYAMLDRMSLIIHHRCKEIVNSEEYRQSMQEAFEALEDELISAHLPFADVHFQRLRLIENLFLRLQNNEPNSYHPFEQACLSFKDGIKKASKDHLEVSTLVSEVYKKMLIQARVAVERNKYCDYKEIDAKIIDWLPWIINDAPVDVIWKFYTENDLFENILSSMILRPRELVLVYSEREVSEKQLNIYRTILAQHGAGKIKIRSISLSEFDLSGLDADAAALQVVDVSGAGDMQHSIVIPPQIGIIYYEKGRLHDKAGSAPRAVYYNEYIPITVNEMLQIKGQKQHSIEENNEILGMETDYCDLWTFARNQHDARMWDKAIKALGTAEGKIRRKVYRCNGETVKYGYRIITDEQYHKLIKNGGIRALYDLQKKKAVTKLSIKAADGDACGWKVGMGVYPKIEKGQDDQCAESWRTIDYILSKDENSEIVVDEEYAKIGKPVLVYDMSDPLKPTESDMKQLERIKRHGLLIDRGGQLTYKSAQIRHALKKEGSALEAYVYYTLFLSGRFDDVRVNVKMQPGVGRNGHPLEKEVDVMVTVHGAMGIISCKDTDYVQLFHIVELAHQAKKYATTAKPILVCSRNKSLPLEVKEACAMLQVERIGMEALTDSNASRSVLVERVLNAIG